MPIDVHAHYVPPQLIDAIGTRGKHIGVRLEPSSGAPPALHFDYGFKVRPFFSRLVEPVGERPISRLGVGRPRPVAEENREYRHPTRVDRGGGAQQRRRLAERVGLRGHGGA